jgi:hypothetical protein
MMKKQRYDPFAFEADDDVYDDAVEEEQRAETDGTKETRQLVRLSPQQKIMIVHHFLSTIPQLTQKELIEWSQKKNSLSKPVSAGTMSNLLSDQDLLHTALNWNEEAGSADQVSVLSVKKNRSTYSAQKIARTWISDLKKAPRAFCHGSRLVPSVRADIQFLLNKQNCRFRSRE